MALTSIMYFYNVLRQKGKLIVGCQVFHQVTQHQNFPTPHYVFACVDPCKSFLFASTNPRRVLKSLYVALHQMIGNHLIDD